jgi:all-trans-8'-apo-beta-carotenal 15,15'-oxygenase
MGKAEMTLDTAKQQTVDFHRGFEGLDEEHSGWVTDLSGRIPEDLEGTLFRNGPGTLRVGGEQYGHWFDGPGMVSAVTFSAGKVHFQNRFVRSPRYVKDQAAGAISMRGFGTQISGGLSANLLRPMANPANTSVSWHASKLCAFYEGAQPYRLDPENLETLGKELYDGGLNSVKTISAHGKINPRNGHQINFGVNITGVGLTGFKVALDVYDIDPAGKIARSCRIPLDGFSFLHDFGMSDHHAVFLLSPIGISLAGPLLGTRTLCETMNYRMGASVQGIVVDLRSMSLARRFELPPGIIVHFANSFETGDELVTDCVQSSDIGNFTGITDVFSIDRVTGGPLHRYRINLRGGTVAHELYHHAPPGEFPAWNMAKTADRTRYIFYVAPLDNGTPFTFNALVKLDTETGSVETADYGRHRYTSEALFAPRRGATAEDDGYLLSVVYDATEHRSDIVIRDAAAIADEVARVHLTHHVPFGFHGHFTPETFRR